LKDKGINILVLILQANGRLKDLLLAFFIFGVKGENKPQRPQRKILFSLVTIWNKEVNFMKKTISILGLISIVLVMSGYFCSTEAISVIPATVKLSIPPGESKGDVFEIRNGGETEVYVKISMKDWVLETNTRKFAEPGTHSRSLCKWITLEEESLNLGPKQSRKIRYMVEVPEKAEGGYWGLVCFESQPIKRAHAGGIKVATQLVSFIGLEVEGTLKRKIEILQVSAKHTKDEGVQLSAELKNVGNVQLFQPSPLGKFKIKDKNNNIIQEGELSGEMLLPNEKGRYISKPFKLDKGEYETIITFDYGEPKLIGKKVILSTESFYDWKVLEKVR